MSDECWYKEMVFDKKIEIRFREVWLELLTGRNSKILKKDKVDVNDPTWT